MLSSGTVRTPAGGDDDASAAVVRRCAGWAALGAALLGYFGFYHILAGITLGGQVQFWTLRCGAVLMVLSTLALLSGRVAALAFDGLACLAIGGGLALSGVLMLTSGGTTDGFLSIVFGIVFGSAGRSGLLMYADLRAVPDTSGRGPEPARIPPADPVPDRPTDPPARTETPLAALLGRRTKSDDVPLPAPTPAPVPQGAPPPAPGGPAPPDSGPSPEGFLARFAHDDQPPSGQS